MQVESIVLNRDSVVTLVLSLASSSFKLVLCKVMGRGRRFTDPQLFGPGEMLLQRAQTILDTVYLICKECLQPLTVPYDVWSCFISMISMSWPKFWPWPDPTHSDLAQIRGSEAGFCWPKSGLTWPCTTPTQPAKVCKFQNLPKNLPKSYNDFFVSF